MTFSSILGLLLSFPVFLVLILTIAFEFIIYSLFIRKDYGKLFLFALLINCFTWPLAMLLFGFFESGVSFFFIEIGVFIVEGFLIKEVTNLEYKRAFILSFIANLLSAGLSFYFQLV